MQKVIPISNGKKDLLSTESRRKVYQFSRADITKVLQIGWLTRKELSHSSGEKKSKIKVLAGPHSL